MKPFSILSWMRCTTWLCLALLCVAGAAQTFHFHSQEVLRGDADAGKTRCTICVTGHAPQQASARTDVQPPAAQEFSAAGEVVRRGLQSFAESRHIRPPPFASL